jgi:hypothetical protein
VPSPEQEAANKAREAEAKKMFEEEMRRKLDKLK